VKVWLDGKLQDLVQARISPLDRGFLYGDGLFETLRAYRGKPFLLAEHLDRLEAAAREVGLAAPPRAVLEDAVRQVLDANAFEGDARVRLTLTRGAGEGPLWPAQPDAPTLLVTAQPVALPAWLEAGGGASLVTSAHRVFSGIPARKSTSFQAHVLAKGEAHRAGAWEALLLNDRGEAAEGATSNLFALLQGQLVTPPPEAGILPGLTRRVVLRLAQPALCLEAREAPLRPADLAQARELFLTSSVAEVVPVVRLDGQAVGDAHPGPVTRAVRAAYRAEVARVLGR
jgi:branched-chain amino acid aminotransferase